MGSSLQRRLAEHAGLDFSFVDPAGGRIGKQA
jgi:hypothetical protein